MKIKQLSIFSASLVLAVSSLFILPPSVSAAPDICIWTGGTNSNMNNSGNWSVCDNSTVPEAGDTLVFPAGATTKTVNNDFPAGTAFAGVAFTDSGYTLGGNSITLTGADGLDFTAGTGTNTVSLDVTLGSNQTWNSSSGVLAMDGDIDLGAFELTTNASSNNSVQLAGVVSNTGTIVNSGTGTLALSGNNTYSGATTHSAGELAIRHVNSLGAAGAGTTVGTGATLLFQVEGAASTAAEPLILTGTALVDRDKLEISKGAGEASEFTLSGAITLNNDVVLSANRPSVISGAITGAGGLAFTKLGTSGSLKLTGTNGYTGATTVSDVMIITGSQAASATTVSNTGTLKGTGTVGALTVSTGGHLAPGLSPGCLISGNTSIAGNFDVELGGTTACTEYDQLQVTGTVDVTSGTLNVSRFGGFTPAVGQTFTIISNDVADAVTGTFAGLAQGATVTVDAYTFTISYTGGDGNDVVLTVTGIPAAATPPAAPNTGFGLIMANPLLTLALTTGAAAALFAASRRYGLITIANRK